MIVDKWMEEYEVPGIINVVKEKMEGMLGYTTFRTNLSELHINEKIFSSSFALDSILWHEFCHAEPWLKYGRTEGHSTEWYKRMIRKPLYCIGCAYAQIYYKVVK